MIRRNFTRATAVTVIGLSVAYCGGTIRAEPAGENELENLSWHDISKWGVEGRGWENTEKFFHRLPSLARETVDPRVWSLSQCTSGMTVRFISESPFIHIRYRLRSSSFSMPHMPTTGVSGVDLYCREESGEWKWVNVGGKSITARDVNQRLVRGLPPGKKTYQLYLPLYNGIESMELGFMKGAFVQPVPRRTEKPIVLVELRPRGNESVLPAVHAVYEGRRREMRAAYDQLLAKGATSLHWLPGKDQLGHDGDATVDGGHPTDLGFMRIADVFEAFLRPLLDRQDSP